MRRSVEPTSVECAPDGRSRPPWERGRPARMATAPPRAERGLVRTLWRMSPSAGGTTENTPGGMGLVGTVRNRCVAAHHPVDMVVVTVPAAAERRQSIARGVSPWTPSKKSTEPRRGGTRAFSGPARHASVALPGLGGSYLRLPGAYAPGYYLSPLRGWLATQPPSRSDTTARFHHSWEAHARIASAGGTTEQGRWSEGTPVHSWEPGARLASARGTTENSPGWRRAR